MKRESFVRISALIWGDKLVAYAFFDMQNYLTDVWKLSLTHAAGILNFWNGFYRILPVFFLYIVHTFLGNFKLLVFTSIAYTAGIGFVAISTPPVLANSTGTCKEYEPECIGHTQKGLLYAGLALIAVGIAGNIASITPLMFEQRERSSDNSGSGAQGDNGGGDPRQPRPPQNDVYQVLGLLCVVIVSLAGAIALPFIKPWTLRFGIPAICTAIGTILFLSGSCGYKKKGPAPGGSPISKVCRVFVAASLNCCQPYPTDERFSSTTCLRILHKAAIKLPDQETETKYRNQWRLCSIEEVEDAKIVVRMVPMSMTFIICGIVSVAGNTYFVEQAGKLNRNIGKLRLPIQVLLLAKSSVKGSVNFMMKSFLKKKIRCDSAPSLGIAAGMICSVLCCVSAALMERKRLKVVMSHGLLDLPDEDIKMSIYWLLFQFVLLGLLESFVENSVNAYYKEQGPESMESYLNNFTRGVSGLGFMCSSILVYVVGKISERGGRTSWFQETLNRSRLDRYFWVLAALCSVNLAVFVVVARRYTYKKPEERKEPDAGDSNTSGYEETDKLCSCFC